MVAAHPIGCNAVSWAPAPVPGALITPQQPTAPAVKGQEAGEAQGVVRRFASAGCDNSVKIWEFR